MYKSPSKTLFVVSRPLEKTYRMPDTGWKGKAMVKNDPIQKKSIKQKLRSRTDESVSILQHNIFLNKKQRKAQRETRDSNTHTPKP